MPLHHRHVLKTAERAWFATKLCALRTFHPARGGEAGVLPGTEVRPRQGDSVSWTSVLVRRATPFAALAAVFAVQALANAEPVVAFPLYLTVVLLVSLQQDRTESIAVAAVAAIAVLFKPLATAGQASDVAPAVLLAAVLVAVAIAMNELTKHSRATAAAAQNKADGLAESERRLRATLESAEVGLALAGLDGRLLETNQPLALILGRSRDELLRTTLGEVIVENDRAAIDEGLALLRSGDVTRWDADTHVVRPDGSAVPAALFIARLPNPIAGDTSLLVQLADISARSRAGAPRDCVAAVCRSRPAPAWSVACGSRGCSRRRKTSRARRTMSASPFCGPRRCARSSRSPSSTAARRSASSSWPRTGSAACATTR